MSCKCVDDLEMESINGGEVLSYLASHERRIAIKRARYQAWRESLDKYDIRREVSSGKGTRWK